MIQNSYNKGKEKKEWKEVHIHVPMYIYSITLHVQTLLAIFKYVIVAIIEFIGGTTAHNCF